MQSYEQALHRKEHRKGQTSTVSSWNCQLQQLPDIVLHLTK